MTLIVVTMYLASNVIHFLLTIIEYTGRCEPATVRTLDQFSNQLRNCSTMFGNDLITYMNDLVSLATQLSYALRLPIYCKYNHDIRDSMRGILTKLSRREPKVANPRAHTPTKPTTFLRIHTTYK